MSFLLSRAARKILYCYIPFFLAANYVPDMKPKNRKAFLIGIWALDALLLITLIPLGVI